MLPWKERSEMPLTDVNGKVTSDLNVTKGKELQGFETAAAPYSPVKKEIVVSTFFHTGALQAHH